MDDTHTVRHGDVPDAELIERFLSGECRPGEVQRLHAWAGVTPDGGYLADLVRAVMQHQQDRGVGDAERTRQALRERLGLMRSDGTGVDANADVATVSDGRPRVHGVRSVSTGEPIVWRGTREIGLRGQTLRQGPWYALAIVAAGVVGLVFGWNGGAHRFVRRIPLLASTSATTNGQRANVTLPDGTIVALNVASRLEVPADFEAGNHTVSVIGEALFIVSHHDEIPLTVISGSARTRVLGTTFVVRHYPTDTATMVAVSDGKVAVGSIVVAARQLVDIGPHGLVHSGLADPSTFSFARGMLTVNDTLLPDAIAELDRWFDADIRLGDPVLAQQRIRGEFVAGSLVDLTNLLEMVLDVRVVRNGRVLTLYPKR